MIHALIICVQVVINHTSLQLLIHVKLYVQVIAQNALHQTSVQPVILTLIYTKVNVFRNAQMGISVKMDHAQIAIQHANLVMN